MDTKTNVPDLLTVAHIAIGVHMWLAPNKSYSQLVPLGGYAGLIDSAIGCATMLDRKEQELTGLHELNWYGEVSKPFGKHYADLACKKGAPLDEAESIQLLCDILSESI